MDWTRMFLFLFGTYLLFLQIANSHHLSGSTIRGVSRRITSRRLNGNRLLRVQTSSTSVNGQFATRSGSRSNPRTTQSSSTSSLQQEVLSLRRRLALAEEERIRAASSRQRLSQIRQSSARQLSQSRSVRPTARGVSMDSRRVSGRMPTNTNRRTFQSNPSNFRRNSGPQIVIELERDNQSPMDKFQDMSSNFRQSSSNNFNIQNQEKQLLEMLSKLLATTPSPVRNNHINELNALLQQLQNDPSVANQLQQVLANAPGGAHQFQPERKTQPPPPPQPPTPQTLWQQVQSLSDPIKARELRQRDPLHFAFLTSLLEGDIPDPPDIPDPIPPQTPHPPVPAKPVTTANVQPATTVQKAETISVPIKKTQIVSAASPSAGKGNTNNAIDSKTNIKTETVVTQAGGKPGIAQKLSETPVFQPVKTQSNAHIQQPKIIVIRDSGTGTNPFVVQTDKFGQSSIVIDTGNPQLQKLINAQQKPTIKPVVPAAKNIADATATTVQKQTVETKVTAKDAGLTVKKEINTKIVSQNGTQQTVVKTAVEVTTVLPVATEPTTLPLEPTEAP